ncbi:hypothetical protein G6N82_03510 [Altererythrobacter sp. BO-6]|nr:hypothetical protein [Altererythrobacter sp. BO-6]QIG53340.1 hypothetical protein G6N82_03510 [Altererythrobacter sp. BO-6]
MNIPQIDLNSLPGLDLATGLYGSATQLAANYDDTIVAIMVYVYDVITR